MPTYITHKVRDKVDKIAYVMVLMERGEWEFPDGKPRWTKDANGIRHPRVVQSEAVKHVWGKVSNNTTLNLFSEKGSWRHLLEERIAYHRQRLDDGYRQALAVLTDDGNALAIMSNKLYESLLWDLNDEETRQKIPFKERAKFFEVLTKMEASIKGDVTTQAKPLQPSVVIQNINVPDAVKARMLESIEGEAVDESEGEEMAAEAQGW